MSGRRNKAKKPAPVVAAAAQASEQPPEVIAIDVMRANLAFRFEHQNRLKAQLKEQITRGQLNEVDQTLKELDLATDKTQAVAQALISYESPKLSAVAELKPTGSSSSEDTRLFASLLPPHDGVSQDDAAAIYFRLVKGKDLGELTPKLVVRKEAAEAAVRTARSELDAVTSPNAPLPSTEPPGAASPPEPGPAPAAQHDDDEDDGADPDPSIAVQEDRDRAALMEWARQPHGSGLGQRAFFGKHNEP